MSKAVGIVEANVERLATIGDFGRALSKMVYSGRFQESKRQLIVLLDRKGAQQDAPPSSSFGLLPSVYSIATQTLHWLPFFNSDLVTLGLGGQAECLLTSEIYLA